MRLYQKISRIFLICALFIFLLCQFFMVPKSECIMLMYTLTFNHTGSIVCVLKTRIDDAFQLLIFFFILKLMEQRICIKNGMHCSEVHTVV